MPVQRYNQIPIEMKNWRRSHGKRRKDIRILEIGVYYGHRARLMVETSINLGLRPTYYGFDLFDDLTPELLKKEKSKPSIPPPPEEVKRYINKRKRAEVSLFKGDTKDTLRDNVSSLPVMDFVFIDGGHSEETVRSDWCYCQRLVGKSSVVIFDDYYHNRPDSSPRIVIDELIGDPKYKTVKLKTIDSLGGRMIGMVKVELSCHGDQ